MEFIAEFKRDYYYDHDGIIIETKTMHTFDYYMQPGKHYDFCQDLSNELKIRGNPKQFLLIDLAWKYNRAQKRFNPYVSAYSYAKELLPLIQD